MSDIKKKAKAASDNDHAQFFQALRASSAKLLKLDVKHLSAAQSVRTDRCSALRLLLDRMTSDQLATGGGVFDARGYIAASQELEKMLGGDPNQASSPLADGNAKERLRRLIETTVLAASVDDPGEAEREAELMRREELACVLAAGGSIEPAAPAPVAPPPRAENVVPFEPKPPDHYLKVNQREPWERYYDGATVPSWPLPR